MKKNFYLTFILVVATVAANAQITITAPPLSNASYIDTFARPTNPADFKSFATPQTNGKWDFTIAQYPNVQLFSLRSTQTSNSYPNAKYRNSISYTFAGGLSYDLYQYFDISSNEITAIGEEIAVEQVLLLGALTGDANDKLVFPVQNIPYSTPQVIRKYPETMGSTFTSTKLQITNFNLTISAYSLNNTPGVRKTYRTATDSVVGWGTAKVRGISTKSYYDNIPVLQVRHKVTVVDSFFLGGNPAPQALLAAFGLQQGSSTDFYYVDFIRQGELDESFRIDFQNSPYQTVDKVEIQQNRLEQYATGLNKLNLQNAINTYPNPIANNTVYVDLPTNESGNWTYTLTDILGRKVSEGSITNTKISLPALLNKGSYILTISNNNAVVSINKILK